MRIVILDGYASNPGDLSWDPLAALGELTVYDWTPPETLSERVKGAQALLVGRSPLRAETLANAPELRYIGTLATGFNMVDAPYCREHGIVVCSVPSYSAAGVAQHTCALPLELTNKAAISQAAAHDGYWTGLPNPHTLPLYNVSLTGKAFGVVGYGRIGRRAAELARAFGMRILAAANRPRPAEEGVTFLPLEELLAQADVVSIHCPLNDETRGLIGREALARMKPCAYLLNTARGPIVDEAALAEALRTGRLAGAGVDVLSGEGKLGDHSLAEVTPLADAPNCVITPHLAWTSDSARRSLIDQCAANLRAFLDGNPVNRVI